MRVFRQWTAIKLRKWSGAIFDHPNPDDTPNGGQVLFCPTCPQPGVNLPEDWTEDKEQSVCFVRFIGASLNVTQMEVHGNNHGGWQLQS